MAKYLVDVNLPYFFKLWNSSDYEHVRDINDEWTDQQIWNYAKQNDMVIITKDSDFAIKLLVEGSPPKIIHIKFGNLKFRDFHILLSSLWENVITQVELYSMINIYLDRIEYIK